MPAQTIESATKKVDPQLAARLEQLQPGARIRIRQQVRVGARSWPAEVEGTFRRLDYLVTGLATERVPDDDIVVPIVHFTKPNGELTSIAIDEHTSVEPA